MRLIDADALVEQEKDFAEKYKGDFGEQVATHTIEIIQNAPTVDVVPDDDLISRKALLAVFGEKPMLWDDVKYDAGMMNQWAEDVNVVKVIPSASLKPNTGAWVKEPGRPLHWHCDNCGYIVGSAKMDYRYCPHCGAYMASDGKNG